jgi:hypothetical protein
VPKPSAFEVELAIEMLKSHKSPGVDQVPTELIKAGCKTIRCRIHKLIFSVFNKEYLSIRKAVKQIVVIIEAYYFCQLRTKFYPKSCCES